MSRIAYENNCVRLYFVYDVYRAYNYWFWVPFIGPHVGAVAGAWIYQIFVGIHFDPHEGEPEPDYDGAAYG